MNNQEAKQEAIKKAWGNNYELVKHYLEAKGFFINNDKLSYLTIGIDLSGIEMEWIGNYYRPIVLKGISDNNGWIRIEPDGSNLPDDAFKECYKGYIFDGTIENFTANRLIRNFKSNRITHYKPITPELKPIF